MLFSLQTVIKVSIPLVSLKLKTVYNVPPFWLNSVTRIEAFLFLYFVALLDPTRYLCFAP